MGQRYDVIARVVSQQGTCTAGHKMGDEFTIGREAPAGLCALALNSLFPIAFALRFGANFPWSPDSTYRAACPDGRNPVVFELRRKP